MVAATTFYLMLVLCVFEKGYEKRCELFISPTTYATVNDCMLTGVLQTRIRTFMIQTELDDPDTAKIEFNLSCQPGEST